MQRIFRLLLVASAIVLGALWLVHWHKTRALNSGEVHVREQPADKATTETASLSQPPQPQDEANAPEAPAASQSRLQPRENVATIPAAETISRNPPNGLVAAGSGKFQLYRQGDLTFRMNTETGEACVLFATEAQWRKQLVYEHGCGSN